MAALTSIIMTAYGKADGLVAKISSLLGKSRRARIYEQANIEFHRRVQGGELINYAPVPAGEPLINVRPEDHDELASLGAVNRDGKWLMPKVRAPEEAWRFKRWFPSATPDLATDSRNFHLTSDGRPSNGYNEVEDMFRGGDSTATSILIVMIPVILSLGFMLSQLPIIGTWLAVAVCSVLLPAHLLALYQAEGFGTTFKVLLFTGLAPAFIGFGGQGALAELTGNYVVMAVLSIITIGALSTVSTGVNSDQSVLSRGSRIWYAFLTVAALAAVNWGLSQLPESMNLVKHLGLFLFACGYPLYYTLTNYLTRAHRLAYQSLLKAGANEGQNEVLGKLAPVRLEQIRMAYFDKTPFVPMGIAQGVLAKHDLAIAPDPWQVMGLTVKDLMSHLHIFGATGTGKTASILRPLALRLATLPYKIGMILTDGKGAMVADMRSLLDIVIEPGIKFAPFQGLSAEDVAYAFTEAAAKKTSGDNAIWTQGAGDFHLYALTILEALIAHEKNRIGEANKRLEAYQAQAEYYAALKVKHERLGLNTELEESFLATLAQRIDAELLVVRTPRRFRWTPTSYSELKEVLSVPVMGTGGVMRASNQARELFKYLGYFHDLDGVDETNATPEQARRLLDRDDRLANDPGSIYAGLHKQGTVLSRAIRYFEKDWPAFDEKHQSSYLVQVNRDINDFLKSDRLRGDKLDDGVVGKDEAWADTEEGIDITQVVFGKRLGINLPATQYHELGKKVAKLVKVRVFREIQLRNERYGGQWQKMTGQTLVMDMCDECQEMVSELEIGLTATARSMGLFFVYATQTIESLDDVMRSHDAKIKYLNNFRSLVSFKSSEATYKYIQSRGGKVKKFKLPTTTQGVIDYVRAVKTYYNTIFADPNHESARVLRDLNRRGATRLQLTVRGVQNFMGLSRKIPVDEMKSQNFIPVHMGGQYEDGMMIEDSDFTTHLAPIGTAVMYLNRASHDRVDFVRTKNIEPEEVEAELAKLKAKAANQTSDQITN